MYRNNLFLQRRNICKIVTCGNLGNTCGSLGSSSINNVCWLFFGFISQDITRGDFSKETVHLQLNERGGRHLGLSRLRADCLDTQLQ